MLAAPVLIAGAHATTQVVLSTAVFATALLYLRQAPEVRPGPFAIVAAVGVMASLLQLVPLPIRLLATISPAAARLRTEVNPAVSWAPTTVDVPATVLEVCKGFGYLGLLLIVGRFARRHHRAKRLLQIIALVGGGIAGLALVQKAVHAETILGFYRVTSMPGSGFFGTFVNGNHAASLFSLSALVGIGCAVETRPRMRAVLMASSAVATLTTFLTASRAGAVGFLIGGAMLTFLLLARRFGGPRALGVTVALVAALAGLMLLPEDGVRSRLFVSGREGLADNQKTRGWRDSVELVADYPWTGVGRGAFEAPVTAYRDDQEGVRLVYPENILLQLTSEWGLPITALLLLLFGRAVVRTGRCLPLLEPSSLAAACGAVGVLVHELADFGLELPGVAIPTVVAIGICSARVEEERPLAQASNFVLDRRKLALAAMAWAIALMAGAWARGHTLWADGEKTREAIYRREAGAAETLRQAQKRHPADYYLELMAAGEAMQARDPQVLSRLNRALRLFPSGGEAHILTARHLARLNRPSQAALEYRLAHERGFIPSPDEVLRATGRHAVDAVPQTPSDLFAFAEWLVSKQQPQLARDAADRAVDRTGATEEALLRRLSVAVSSRNAELVTWAADPVLASRPSAAAYEAVTLALESVGEHARAASAASAGMAAHPRSGGLVLLGARLRHQGGDAQGAQELLTTLTRTRPAFPISDRIAAERLSASLAERAGDNITAAVARTRAKLLERQVRSGAAGSATAAE